jgi:hypothetical protein
MAVESGVLPNMAVESGVLPNMAVESGVLPNMAVVSGSRNKISVSVSVRVCLPGILRNLIRDPATTPLRGGVPGMMGNDILCVGEL